MTFRQERRDDHPVVPDQVLILPDHVGRSRYGAPIGEQLTDADRERPFLYCASIGGREFIITNAPGYRQRIPIDEMEAMALEVANSAKIKEQKQITADYVPVFQNWRQDLYQWELDRRNGRQLWGAGTFKNRRGREKA